MIDKQIKGDKLRNDHVISRKGSSASFDILTSVTLIDWQVLILTAVILLEINWHDLSILIEGEVENWAKM